jgi:hypothetical protein
MLKAVKFVLPCCVLAAGMAVTSMQSFATPAIAKKEGGQKCTVCHVTMGKKDLNDVGKCYKESKNLASCTKK